MAYGSTKWLFQPSSSSLESFSVRPMSWVLLHSMQPQASVHDITLFRQENLPPTQWPLRQLQLMNCKSASGAGCWSIQWMDMWPSITSQPWPCGLCILSAEQFVPNSVRVFTVVSVQWAYKPSTSVRRRGWTNYQPPSWQRACLGRTRPGNGTPAFCLFQRMHLCCHIRLTHVFQSVLCTHIHQAIVQWQSCQGTSFVASYRYWIASWH